MRLKRHVSLLDTALRRPVSHSLLPALRLRCIAHRYSSTSGDSPANVAVLGGGIAGLSSAYFISKNFPQSKVTVYESAGEAGGWIRSKRIEVPGGDIVFESGPRTLRYSPITAHLIQDLGLTDDLTYTLKTDPAAANRFIYYPDRLNKISFNGMSLGEVFSMWRGGLLRGVSGFVREIMNNRRPASLHDETVGSWVSRRMDKRLANNLISAVFHGIYAGDIWQLSAKTLIPLPWNLEGKYESAIVGHLTASQKEPPSMLAHPYDIEVARAVDQDIDLDPKFLQRLRDASTYTFKNGLQHLIHKLQASLDANPNVTLNFNTPVLSTKYEASEQPRVALTTGDSSSPTTTSYDFVVSSLRHPTLTPYVTVMTVNLYYPTPNITPEPGFGYLLPQSLPFTQNPERALGVIFDSDAASHQDTAPGTKLTVMLGGHWWDGWAGYPTEAEGVEMAKNVVARHLGITEAPTAWNVGLHRDCIPQYTLGYEDRLATFQDELVDEFKGRLRVVGNQVNGVGINDCVAGAWNLAREMKWGGWRGRSVGLEKVKRRAEEWRLVPIREMGYRTSR